MITAYYRHRLPATYDLGLIRARARERGRLWDNVPHLHFKAFLLRQTGHLGATSNSYASLYLWADDAAFRGLLTSGGFKIVTNSFGRPRIDTHVVLDARRGAAQAARYAVREQFSIPADADLEAALAAEIEHNRTVADDPRTLASAVGIDAANWTLVRIRLAAEPPPPAASVSVSEILHLAAPELGALATAGT